jgi:hypothetical protein
MSTGRNTKVFFLFGSLHLNLMTCVFIEDGDGLHSCPLQVTVFTRRKLLQPFLKRNIFLFTNSQHSGTLVVGALEVVVDASVSLVITEGITVFGILSRISEQFKVAKRKGSVSVPSILLPSAFTHQQNPVDGLHC